MATLYLPLIMLLLLVHHAVPLVVHAEPPLAHNSSLLSLSSRSQFFPALSWPPLASSSNMTAFVNKYSLLPAAGPFNLFSPILSTSGFFSSHKGFSLGFLSAFQHTDSASPAQIFLAVCLGSAQKDVNGQIFAAPVWVANKHTPLIVPKQGKIGLFLNSQKELLLLDGNGRIVWAVRSSVESMELRENGNLAIYNSENETVWQSFDYPGDIILQGQALPLGKRIVSGNSLYVGEMKAGGLLFYMQSSSSVPLAYFIFAVNITVDIYFSEWVYQGTFELSRDLPVNLTAAIYSEVSFTPPCLSAKHVPFVVLEGEDLAFEYADKCPPDFKVPFPVQSYFQNRILDVSYNSDLVRLDADGVMRGYTYVNHKGDHFFSSGRVNSSLCLSPNTCGSYSLCSHYALGQDHICKCPSAEDNPDLFNAFAPVDSHDPSLGCRRTVPLQCKEGVKQSLVRVPGVTSIIFRALFEATLMYHTVPLDDCLRQCDSNCSCAGIYYHSSSSFCLPFSDGTPVGNVSLLKLSTEEYATYLKVQFSRYRGNASVGGAGKSGSSRNKLTKRFLPALIVAGLLVVGCIVTLFIAHKYKQWGSRRDLFIDEMDPELENILPMLPTRFSYKELDRATNGFSKMVGKGGFGSVFEGVLADSRKVAVKRLEMVSPQVKPFLTEVATIGGISHHNIVRLCGFCSERTSRLLVYEYLENSSLDRWLFCKKSNKGSDKENCAALRGGKIGYGGEDDGNDEASCRSSNGESKEVVNKQKSKKVGYECNNNGDNKVYTVLSWETRYNVALGTARALTYLHEDSPQPILHFDIKPENILLDADFVPKVADFGLAKLVDRGASSVYTVVRGTAGYMAPEWLSHSMASNKCDVYSYGMVLLELIGGRRNADPAYLSTDQWYLPKWAATCCREGKEGEIVDKRLKGCYDAEQVKRFVQVAFLCIHKQPRLRPSMSTVCKLLEGSCKMPSGSYNGILDTSQEEQLPLSNLLLETLSQYDNMQAIPEIVYNTHSGPSLPYSSIEGR